MNPLEALLDLVDAATATYIAGTVVNIVHIINPIFRNLLILFFILYGIAIWRGVIQSPASDFVVKIVLVSFVYAAIFEWSIYNQFIVNFLTNGPDALAAAIAGFTSHSISDTISQSQGLCFDAMMNAFRGDGYIMKYIIGATIFVASTLVVAYAGFLLVVPKIALSVLVAFGPICFLMLLFKGTRRMFDAWFQQCLNFFLYIVFTVMVLALFGGIFRRAVEGVPTSPDAITFGTIVPLTFVCVVIWLVLKQIPAFASAIAGGVQITTLAAESAPGRLVGGMFRRLSYRRGGGRNRIPTNIVNQK